MFFPQKFRLRPSSLSADMLPTPPRRRVIRRREGTMGGRRAAKDNTRRRRRRRFRHCGCFADARAHVRERHEGKEGRREGRTTVGRRERERERERESGITGNKWLLLSALSPSFPPSPYSAIPSRRLSKGEEEDKSDINSPLASNRQRSVRMEWLAGSEI